MRVWEVWISDWEWNRLIALFKEEKDARVFQKLSQKKLDEVRNSKVWTDEIYIEFLGENFKIPVPMRDDEDIMCYSSQVY